MARFGPGAIALLCASVALFACRRKPEPAPTPKAIAAPSQPSASAATSARPATSSALEVEALDGTDETAALVVREWNDALDRHDAQKLGRLYADEVRFYGRTLSKTAVIAAKRAAFAKEPSFRQTLVGKLAFERASDGSLTARFAKRSGAAGGFRVVSARLVLSLGDAGTFLVVEEADETTAPSGDSDRERCEEVTAEIVNALPQVKRAVEELGAEADKSDGGARFGGIGPNDDGDGGFAASYGLHTDERYDARIQYSVDRKGRLSVHVPAGEVALPAKALRAVEQACRR